MRERSRCDVEELKAPTIPMAFEMTPRWRGTGVCYICGRVFEWERFVDEDPQSMCYASECSEIQFKRCIQRGKTLWLQVFIVELAAQWASSRPEHKR